MNLPAAIRGMRNPLNSWGKSDSCLCPRNPTISDCGERAKLTYPCRRTMFLNEFYCIGENDLALAQKLIKAGSDHRKFMRQIIVSVDITAPLYWWKEFDTYKVGTVANSCSTMHTITKKEFTLDDFSTDRLVDDSIHTLNIVINDLNILRGIYNNFENEKALTNGLETKEDVWYQIIQLLPSSYNQLRTVTFSYENLRNIYGSRRNHKLTEWRVGFMSFIDSLPYADELIKVGIGE